MTEIIADFRNDTYLGTPVVVARLALALLLAAVLGIEREWRDRPAGLRTHILVSLAAASAALLTLEIVHMGEFQTDRARIDPIRLVEAVTAGVAFLAAGFIVFSRGKVRGLTTGAGMWLAGVIGLAAGLGLWQIAVVATGLGFVVLALVRQFETGTDLKDADAPDDEA